MKDHIALDGLQIDDFCTELYVEVEGVNTVLTFENGRGTMQNAFILDRDSLQWLRKQLKKANKLTQRAAQEAFA